MVVVFKLVAFTLSKLVEDKYNKVWYLNKGNKNGESENQKISNFEKLKNWFKKGILHINGKIGYSFYWGMVTSMQVDLLIGAWPSLKALSSFSFWGITSSLILGLLCLNYFVYIVVVTRGFFDFYLPKAQDGSLGTYEIVYRSKYPDFVKIFEDMRQESVYGV